MWRKTVIKIGYYLFIDGRRLVRSGGTDCFRQELLAKRGCRE